MEFLPASPPLLRLTWTLNTNVVRASLGTRPSLPRCIRSSAAKVPLCFGFPEGEDALGTKLEHPNQSPVHDYKALVRNELRLTRQGWNDCGDVDEGNVTRESRGNKTSFGPMVWSHSVSRFPAFPSCAFCRSLFDFSGPLPLALAALSSADDELQRDSASL
jgi:hypothetical protein